ncbi:unnamed protein product, partial [Hapterophycus canaliculatus]
RKGERINRFVFQSMVWVIRVAVPVALLLFAAVCIIGQREMEGTLMFLHVWKCGGTTLRQLMCDWADLEGLTCAQVAGCRDLSLQERKICLANHKLIYPEIQGEFIANQRVLAGHFRWGFQVYAAEPHLLLTTLRNPLELFVSGEQYLNRGATSTLRAATQHMDNAMRKSLVHPTRLPGFLHRLVGHRVLTSEEIRQATVEAAKNLNSFWLVGVMEQYAGFISVIRALLDPSEVHADLWRPHFKKKLNASPVQSTNVLAGLDPNLVQQFNSTLSYQWLVYGHAVRLFTARCQAVLPENLHGELCQVPNPPTAYV